MDGIEKIFVGVVLFILTSVVAYLFRMRQLYVTVPKLYRHAAISKAGSLCELIVYNRGNQPEESIQVALDPDVNAELLASSSTDIVLQKSTLIIERLHRRSEASAMLLVENGVLDVARIRSVSSKGTKGRVCTRVSVVPPNYARYFLLLLTIAGFVPGLEYAWKGYRAYSNSIERSQLSLVYKDGWKDLGDYYSSKLRKSYSDQEFPIRFISRQLDAKKGPTLTFEVYNKTALKITVYTDSPGQDRRDTTYFGHVEVPPLSRQTMVVVAQQSTPDVPHPERTFIIHFGEEYLSTLVFVPPVK